MFSYHLQKACSQRSIKVLFPANSPYPAMVTPYQTTMYLADHLHWHLPHETKTLVTNNNNNNCVIAQLKKAKKTNKNKLIHLSCEYIM